MLFRGNAVGCLQQLVKPHLLFLPGKGVRHFCRGRAFPGGENEGEHGIVPHLLHQGEGILELLVRFSRESHDNIRGQHQIGHILPGKAHLFQIGCPVIVAVHCLNDPVIARLHRQMQLMGALLALRHGFEQLFRGVFGVRGHKANDEVPGNVVDGAEQVRKIHRLVQILAVGVHILPQQSDFLIAFCHQLPCLFQNFLRTAGALPTADIRHHAVGAEVVAAVHNGQPCLHLAVPGMGNALIHGALGRLHGKHPLFPGHLLQQQLRETPQLMGSEHQIHNGIGLFQLFRHVLLLHHAAAHRNNLVRIFGLGMGQIAHVAQHPHFRMFPNGAGVDDHQIRLGFVLSKAVAHFLQISPQTLAVRLILLAAVGIHHGQQLLAAGFVHCLDASAQLHLRLDFLRGQFFTFVCHKYS